MLLRLLEWFALFSPTYLLESACNNEVLDVFRSFVWGLFESILKSKWFGQWQFVLIRNVVNWLTQQHRLTLSATTELSFGSVNNVAPSKMQIHIESNKIFCILQKLETKIENMEQVVNCGSDYEFQDPDSFRKS